MAQYSGGLPISSLFPAQGYKYTAIAEDQIRCLHIQPGHGDQDIQCELLPYGRTDGLAYKALSYCWGAGPASFRIFVQGGTIYIRYNLFLALKRLRDPRKVVSIWVDALCIDQSNNVEKSAQVASMDDVYRRTTEVIIWLGSIDPKIDQAFRFLSEFNGTRDFNFTDGRHSAATLRDLCALSLLLSNEYL